MHNNNNELLGTEPTEDKEELHLISLVMQT